MATELYEESVTSCKSFNDGGIQDETFTENDQAMMLLNLAKKALKIE